MNQDDLAKALKAAVEAAYPTISVGIAEAPSETPDLPYAIIYPLGAMTFEGPFDNPFDTAIYTVQVRSVGRTTEQTGWVQEKIRGVVLDRAGNGQWAHSLAVGGVEPEYRSPVVLGAITPADTELHQADDRYQLRSRIA